MIPRNNKGQFIKGFIPATKDHRPFCCPICKKTVLIPAWRFYRVKFCSQPCKIEAFARKMRKPVYSMCGVCSKKIRSVPSDPRFYCSRKCSGVVHSQKMTGRPSKTKGIPTGRIPKTAFKKDDPRLMGEKNSSWRGGITPLTVKIRHSVENDQWRKAVFERDNYQCRSCGARSGKGRAIILHADHRLPFALYPRLRFDLINGQTLCKDCHMLKTKWERSMIRIMV